MANGIYEGGGGTSPHSYKLEWRKRSSTDWHPFDDPPGEVSDDQTVYLLHQIVSRMEGTSFGIDHTVKITRDDGTCVYHCTGKTEDQLKSVKRMVTHEQHRLEGEWSYNYSSNSTEVVINTTSASATVQKEKKQMKLSQTLTVKRKTLIEKVKAKIETQRTAHEERNAKTRESRKKRVENFLTLLGNDTEKVVYDLANGWYDDDRDEVVNGTNLLLDKLDLGTITIEQALAEMKNWSVGALPEFKPLPQEAKLLAVLEAATNDTLEVEADDDLYPYL